MDAERYAAVTAAGLAQMAAYEKTAERLAQKAVEARSRDYRIRARAAAGGHVVGLRLSEDVLLHYTIGALSDVVTRTVREAQRRAADAFQRGLDDMDLSAAAEADQIVAELEEEGRRWE